MGIDAFMRQERKVQKLPNVVKGVEYITPREFATIIRAHYVTVIKWLDAGKIEGAVKVGGRWKIPLKTPD